MLPLVGLPSYEEVFRLHVAVYKVLGMHVLHPRDLQGKREAVRLTFMVILFSFLFFNFNFFFFFFFFFFSS